MKPRFVEMKPAKGGMKLVRCPDAEDIGIKTGRGLALLEIDPQLESRAQRGLIPKRLILQPQI